jgi:sugar/nucleoside kinase (ribokinase family)
VSANRPYDLLVVGELNVDIIVRGGDIVPRFGQAEQLVEDLTVQPGSSGGIFAAAAAKMGLRVLYASVVGDDPFGHLMVAALQACGVDTAGVRIDPGVKTGAGLMLSRGQDRAMLTYLGSIASVSQNDVNPAWFDQARHLHVVSPFLMSGLRPYMPEMMALAKRRGMTVSLDTNWDPQEQWALDGFFDHLDLFLPNEQEALAITRRATLDAAIDALHGMVGTLVVKRGASGAVAYAGELSAAVPVLPVSIVDSTGAGDSFDAGFLAGWLRGETLETCLRLGAACGALTCTQAGGFNGQPTWAQARALATSAAC